MANDPIFYKRFNDTLERVAKAQTTGISTQSGLAGIDLTELINTYFYETEISDYLGAEKAPMGGRFSQWETINRPSGSIQNPFSGFDEPGTPQQIETHTEFAPYGVISYRDTVTQDAYYLTQGYSDVNKDSVDRLLGNFLLAKNESQFNGTTVVTNPVNSITLTEDEGGGIPAGSYTIYCAVRGGFSYYFGGNSKAVKETITVTGEAAVIKATASAGFDAVMFDWGFQKGSGSVYYAGTTLKPEFEFQTVVTKNAEVPADTYSGLNNLVIPTFNTTKDNGSRPLKSDGSVAESFDGLLNRYLMDKKDGRIVKFGSGNANPAYHWDNKYQPLNALGNNVEQLTETLKTLTARSYQSPTHILVGFETNVAINNLITDKNQAMTWFDGKYVSRKDITGGANVRWLMNASRNVQVEVIPSIAVPAGVIVVCTRSLSKTFGTNLGKTSTWRYLIDNIMNSYAPTPTDGGFAYRPELKSIGTVPTYVDSVQAIIKNIAV